MRRGASTKHIGIQWWALFLLQVKAWCYYEARLLGAHHGLLSTYALETLVLAAFNKHHAVHPFTSPLQVIRAKRSGAAVLQHCSLHASAQRRFLSMCHAADDGPD